MAKATGSAGRVGRERLDVNPIQGPGGLVVYQVGGSQGKIFSTRQAADRFANRERIPSSELPTMPVMRKGREVGRRRMTLPELASNADFTDLKVNDRVLLRGIGYTVMDTRIYNNPDIIQLRSDYNDYGTYTRQSWILGNGRKIR